MNFKIPPKWYCFVVEIGRQSHRPIVHRTGTFLLKSPLRRPVIWVRSSTLICSWEAGPQPLGFVSFPKSLFPRNDDGKELCDKYAHTPPRYNRQLLREMCINYTCLLDLLSRFFLFILKLEKYSETCNHNSDKKRNTGWTAEISIQKSVVSL